MSDKQKKEKVPESAAKTETAPDSVQDSGSARPAKPEQEKEILTGIPSVGHRPRSTARKPLYSRKWMVPATYLAAAAIILALMWVIQDLRSTGTEPQTEEAAEDVRDVQDGQPLPEEEALPAGAPVERMQWPADPGETEVVMPFYDPAAGNEEKQAAILQQGNRYTPNTGIVLAREDNETFDVRAALSGEVTRAEKVPTVGNLVEITHEDGLKTIYYSLADVEVKPGDKVAQGDRIGKAGRNELGKAFGVHLHFEVHKDGEPVNPATLLEYPDTAGPAAPGGEPGQAGEPGETGGTGRTS